MVPLLPLSDPCDQFVNSLAMETMGAQANR